MEKNAHILVVVSGGIAAYKACDIVSRLVKTGADVRVIETENAKRFVPPLTFEALSGFPVEEPFGSADPIAHITLAKWADLVIAAPMTANLLAKTVHGLADDLPSTTLLACTCPILLCPAMNTHMYENPITQANLKRAKEFGFHVLEPDAGHLACGDTGTGKLPQPEVIVEAGLALLAPAEKPLAGKTVLVSAGPTQEALDPVRFLSNHSSGKQGYAIAQAARELGAEVCLVSGPVSLNTPEGVERVDIVSAEELFEAIKEKAADSDYIIMAAAVGDYRPEFIAEHKIKKSGDTLVLELVKNPDILAWLGEHKKENQVLCGFAMETENLEANAREKLEKKNCDLLIANNLFTPGAGFQTDTNVASLLFQDHTEHPGLLSKEELGRHILLAMKKLEEERACL